MSASLPRILFQTFNRRGLGHFMRGHNIARQIRLRSPGSTIRFYVRCDVPPEMKSAAFEYYAESDSLDVSHWPVCIQEFLPDVIVYDTMLPADSEQELSHAHASRVYVMRKCKLQRQQEVLAHPFLRQVDAILIPHSKQEFELEIPAPLIGKTLFVGPIVRTASPEIVQQLRIKYQVKTNSFIVISSPGGGGFQQEAESFLEIVCQVHDQLIARLPGLLHIVVTGPKFLGTINQRADMTVVQSEPEMVSLISLADLTISAGGYNTVHEIRATKSPAVFLPSPRTHDDQTQRVNEFEKRGLAVVLSGLSRDQAIDRIVRLCTDPVELSNMRRRYQSDEMAIGNSRAADRILELCQIASQPGSSGCDVTPFIGDGGASLSRHLQQRGDPDISCTVRVLDHSPHERMVVEYEATSPIQPNLQCIGKFYFNQQAELGQVSFETMIKLRRALSQPEYSHGVLRIPAALYYDPGIQCLFQQKALGAPFTDLVQTDTLRFALHQAGVALSQLHALDVGVPKAKSLADHIAELVRPQPAILAEQFPEYGQTIRNCLELIHHSEANWSARLPVAPIHRDFQLRQLFLEGDAVWLVDWDLFAQGDPAFDVGYFVAYLKTHLPDREFESAKDAFLRGYSKNGRVGFQERLPVYLAFNFLRRACRRLRIRDENWEAEIKSMMELIESLEI